MKKILIAYDSRSGNTEKIANLLAEGIRIVGNEVKLENISKINQDINLAEFDGLLLGCPTYHKDMMLSMKNFLFAIEKSNLVNTYGGSFGSHTHSGEASPMIFDTMQYVFKMKMISLGPLNMTEIMINTDEGMKACHQYAKEFCNEMS